MSAWRDFLKAELGDVDIGNDIAGWWPGLPYVFIEGQFTADQLIAMGQYMKQHARDA